MVVVVVILFWAGVGGLIGYAIGNSKGRGTEGFWLGFFLGIIGWIIEAFQKPSASVAAERAALSAVVQGQATELRERERLRPCPWCAEPIRPEARVCRFCGRDVEPVQSDNGDLAKVQQEHPGAFNIALPYLNALTEQPANPTDWLRELCRRIEAGSPPSAAAARIPLDWSSPATAMPPSPPPVVTPRAPHEAGDYPAVESEFPTRYDAARSAMAGLAERPVHPEAWLRELCRRIEAGSPPAAAAARIPLDWS
jgi:hypothetical protein